MHLWTGNSPWVYPRACGGTHCRLRNGDAVGLSPRVRGNLRVARWYESGATGVYPRACGGTAWLMVSQGMATGLSPRVRGNLFPMFSHRAWYAGLSPRVRGNRGIHSQCPS